MSHRRIIIITSVAEDPGLSPDEQQFMRDVAAAIRAGQEIDRETRTRVVQLLGKAMFGQ